MNLFHFIKQFLFIDQKSGMLSHTKFWSQVGYLIMCWSFVYIIWKGQTGVGYELWLIFGSVVVGNRTVAKALNTFANKKDLP